jgi:hypothetical protein
MPEQGFETLHSRSYAIIVFDTSSRSTYKERP